VHSLDTTKKLPSPSRTWLKILPNAKKTTGYEQFKKPKERFRKHIHAQMYFAGKDNDWNPKQLFIAKEDWEVDINELPRKFCARINVFCKKLRSQFQSQGGTPNLTRHQQQLLETLRKSQDFIVFPSDKNLGPCIIERTKYMQAALHHLSDAATYERLEPGDALQAINALETDILTFFSDYNDCFSKEDITFLW
jgi:hypothetical protein